MSVTKPYPRIVFLRLMRSLFSWLITDKWAAGEKSLFSTPPSQASSAVIQTSDNYFGVIISGIPTLGPLEMTS